MLKIQVPVRTLLSDTGSLTDDEKRELAEEWAERKLNVLLEYAERNRPFALSLCTKVADRFGPDDELSGVLTKSLRVTRTGKRTGRHKKWTYVRYLVLLTHYCALYAPKTRQKTLEQLADMEGFTGEERWKKIEAKITEGLKQVRKEDLLDLCKYFRDKDLPTSFCK